MHGFVSQIEQKLYRLRWNDPQRKSLKSKVREADSKFLKALEESRSVRKEAQQSNKMAA